MSRNLLFVPLLLATGIVLADEVPPEERVPSATEAQEQAPSATEAQEKTEKTEGDAKNLDGMSILGNQEAPKALVIVPWKSSQIGASLGISTMLDDTRQPIDKEVFMRALSYYEIRSETTRHDGAAAGKSDAAQPATAAHRR